MVIEKEIKVGSKYRFVSQSIDEVVTVTESPIKIVEAFWNMEQETKMVFIAFASITNYSNWKCQIALAANGR